MEIFSNIIIKMYKSFTVGTYFNYRDGIADTADVPHECTLCNFEI